MLAITLPDVKACAAQADMNVSLTAIALIWNAADQLAKLAAHGGASDGEPPGEDSAAAQQATGLSAAHLEALLRQLFSALQVRPAEGFRVSRG